MPTRMLSQATALAGLLVLVVFLVGTLYDPSHRLVELPSRADLAAREEALSRALHQLATATLSPVCTQQSCPWLLAPVATAEAARGAAVVTRYQFDLVLAGDGGGGPEFSESDRQAFAAATSTVLRGLHTLRGADLAIDAVVRREHPLPLGLRALALKDATNGTHHVPRGARGALRTLLDAVHSTLPVAEADAESECVQETGCTLVQMVFYAVPPDAAPCVFAGNRAGVVLDGSRGIVLMNGGPDGAAGAVAAAAAQLRRVLGLPAAGGVLTADDALQLQLQALLPIHRATWNQLATARALAGLSPEADAAPALPSVAVKMTAAAADRHAAAAAALSESEEVLLEALQVVDGQEPPAAAVPLVRRAYAHATDALRLALRVNYDPDLLPELYFPVDQQILLFLPFWLPMLVPLGRGLAALRASAKPAPR